MAIFIINLQILQPISRSATCDVDLDMVTPFHTDDTYDFLVRVDLPQSSFYFWPQSMGSRILAVSDVIRVFSEAGGRGQSQNSTGWQSPIESLKLRFLQKQVRVGPICLGGVVRTSLGDKEGEEQVDPSK